MTFFLFKQTYACKKKMLKFKKRKEKKSNSNLNILSIKYQSYPKSTKNRRIRARKLFN